MQKNTNIRTMPRRRKTPLWLFIAYSYADTPRLLLETFLRRHFGVNYYSLWKAFKIAVALFHWPILIRVFPVFMSFFSNDPGVEDAYPDFWWHYASWYLFVAAFIVCAVKRKLEATKNEGDTLYGGYIFPFFIRMTLFGKPATARFIETVAEPLFTFAIGFLLYLIEQPIGVVIMVCSVAYSISYIYCYRKGDDKLAEIHDAGSQGHIFRNVPFAEKEKPTPEEPEDVF